MKYFCSIENNEYCRWQAELLIESFNMKGLQDDLIIAIADSQDYGSLYRRNLNNHKNKFAHKNAGEKIGFLPFNKIVGLIIAIDAKLIEEDFVFLHPDMILIKPFIETDINIVFYPNLTEEDCALKMIRQTARMPEWAGGMGQTMVFNKDTPYEYLKEVMKETRSLASFWKNYNLDINRACWMSASPKFFPNLQFQGSYALETPLSRVNELASVIHYSKKIPHFNKEDFRNGINLSGNKDPIASLVKACGEDTNFCKQYLQEVIDSYWGKTQVEALRKRVL